MAFSGKQPIGTMLVQAGKIDDDQLQKGLLAQREKEGYIGETFVELGYIEPKELNNYISHQLKIPFSPTWILQYRFVIDGSIF